MHNKNANSVRFPRISVGALTNSDTCFSACTPYTGVRPLSIVAMSKIKSPEYLKWKHVKIWREGVDDRGFKIICPYLKAHSRYFSEDKWTNKKTLVSGVAQDEEYVLKLDIVSNTLKASNYCIGEIEALNTMVQQIELQCGYILWRDQDRGNTKSNIEKV
ncbi:hypothetical protein A0J61_05038 [Choanephora cucurbitarum]|uniref:Uncharacterized protein n=1 Tax=Choanephora cucurbitarum TaxID=101091 RepID=A0A1C7ND82_9FUNG|nr:hypothetical protein A0J61_05038 [Choanephora cucurbitarum]